jgi:hypothetical protein
MRDWLGRTFGAAPTDATPHDLVVVFEGHPTACEAVALRLQAHGLVVHPDPRPRYAGHGRANLYRPGSGRSLPIHAATVVAVRRPDHERALEIVSDAQPI